MPDNSKNVHPVADADRILRPAELSKVLGLGKTKTYELMNRPDFPRPVRLTESVRGWFFSEVMAWLKDRRSN